MFCYWHHLRVGISGIGIPNHFKSYKMTKDSLVKAQQTLATIDTLATWIADVRDRNNLNFIQYGTTDMKYLAEVQKEVYAAALKIFKKHHDIKQKEFTAIK